MSIDTTRRSFLKAAPVAALAVSLPAVALAAPDARREWDFAMARYTAAKRASDDYTSRVWDPEYYRAKAFEEAHGVFMRDAEGNWISGYHDKRKALLAQFNYEVPDHINDEQERRADAADEAQTAVMKTPAPDLAALRWKLHHLTDDGTSFGASWSDDYAAQTLADMARLLPEGR